MGSQFSPATVAHWQHWRAGNTGATPAPCRAAPHVRVVTVQQHTLLQQTVNRGAERGCTWLQVVRTQVVEPEIIHEDADKVGRLLGADWKRRWRRRRRTHHRLAHAWVRRRGRAPGAAKVGRVASANRAHNWAAGGRTRQVARVAAVECPCLALGVLGAQGAAGAGARRLGLGILGGRTASVVHQHAAILSDGGRRRAGQQEKAKAQHHTATDCSSSGLPGQVRAGLGRCQQG